jgi:hypothetical protein
MAKKSSLKIDFELQTISLVKITVLMPVLLPPEHLPVLLPPELLPVLLPPAPPSLASTATGKNRLACLLCGTGMLSV